MIALTDIDNVMYAMHSVHGSDRKNNNNINLSIVQASIGLMHVRSRWPWLAYNLCLYAVGDISWLIYHACTQWVVLAGKILCMYAVGGTGWHNMLCIYAVGNPG